MNDHLMRETTQHGLVYEPVWAMGVDYNNDDIEFAWCKAYREDSSRESPLGSAMRVIANGEQLMSRSYPVLQKNISHFRKEEIQEEMKQDGKISLTGEFSANDIADLTVEIFERFNNGEYVGQTLDLLYVQDVASILGVSFQQALEAVDNILIPQKRLGLQGFILITHSSYKENKDFLKKSTGHEDIFIMEFNGFDWHCSSCGNGGDEYGPEPSSVPCVKDDK